MHLRQCFRAEHVQELKQEQRLTHEQKMMIDMSQLQLRRDVVEALYGEKFSPRATCPVCNHALTDFEIMKGFRTDPTDYTTKCPKCRKRFLARLHRSTKSGWIEMAFYCPSQTLGKLKDMTSVSLADFQSINREIYNSAIIHFGGLKQAFKQIGLTYKHEADLDWKNRIGLFLGKMPDTVIAELVFVSTATVSKVRRERGIRAYNKRTEAENFGNEG